MNFNRILLEKYGKCDPNKIEDFCPSIFGGKRKCTFVNRRSKCSYDCGDKVIRKIGGALFCKCI